LDPFSSGRCRSPLAGSAHEHSLLARQRRCASNRNVQLISDGERRPFSSAAPTSTNGSRNVYLDDGVTLIGGQKLYLKLAADKTAKPAKTEPAITEGTTIR
jgi:hypothetical protein